MDDQTQIKNQNSKIKNDDAAEQPVEDTAGVATDESTNAAEEVAKDKEEAIEETVEAAEEKAEDVADNNSEAKVIEEAKETVEAASTDSSSEPKEETLDEALKPSPKQDDSGAKWYIVHTYSGHENKVSKNLKQRIQALGFEDRIFDVLVPLKSTIKVTSGKKESVNEKIFPGYVLVKMILDNESWLLVRTTQGVTSFIGAGNKPTPISEKEVEAIQKFMNTEEPLYKTAFSMGEAVKIVDGPFSDFLGTIDEIDEAKGKVKVLVSIFGRETPVELDFLQVAKL
jgi:transcription termination/antitermination protein NusG